MSVLNRIRTAVNQKRVELSDHALEEMDNDDLTLDAVKTVLLYGELHRTYDDDPRGVRYVVRGAIGEAEVDVVCRFKEEALLWIITVYVVTEG